MRKKLIIVVLLFFAALVLFGCTQAQNNPAAAQGPNTGAQTIQNSNQPDFTPQPLPETQPPAPLPATQPPAPETQPVTQPPTLAAITIQNYSFSPSTITVPAGTKVTWTNSDSVSHTVTENNGAFDSGDFGNRQTFSYTFNTPGTYSYHCGIHPLMKATITVQ